MRRHAKVVVAALALLVSLVLGVTPAGASKGVLTHFGSQGSGDGQFETPRGVAVNESGAGGVGAGDVYVVDEGNNRVQRFDAAGNYLAQFGTAGASAGQLAAPKSLAVDQATGNLYVSEAGNLRVQAFDAQGNFLWMAGNGVNTGTSGNSDLCTDAGAPTDVCGAGSAGTAGGQLGGEAGLAVAPSAAPNAGNILIADRANSRVQELTSSGAFIRAFGWDANSPDGEEAFEECTVATDCLPGDPGSAAGQFSSSQPGAIAEDSSGAIYALERLRVQKFTPQLGPPALNPLGAFDPADLTGTGTRPLGDLAIGASDHLFVLRTIPGAASTCPDGSASTQERRVLEVDSAGVLQDTHMACAKINPTNGFALNATTGLLYVSSTAADHRVYVLDDIVPPSATALAPTEVTTTTATLNGTVNPNGTAAGDQTSYFFELSSDAGATWAPLEAQDAGTGALDLPVSFAKTGLLPNTEYRYRLTAAKAFGNPAATSAALIFTTGAAPPTVDMATTTSSANGAVLRSRLNPNSSATTFHFDYGPTGAYGSSTPELPAGSGSKAAIVEQLLNGLQPNSICHYRLLATNSAGTTHGPDRTVATGPGLGEDRAYEMVSPPQRLGNDVMIDGSRTRAASDGNAVQFASLGAFGDALGTGISVEYIAERGADSWHTHSITPLHRPQNVQDALVAIEPHYVGELSGDLDTGVYLSQNPLAGAAPDVASVKNLYLRQNILDPGPGDYRLITEAEAPVSAFPEYSPAYAGASTDFSHLLFMSPLNLTSDAPAQDPTFCGLFRFCKPRLYEQTPAGVSLVGQVPVPPATTCTGNECVPAEGSSPGRLFNGAQYTTDTMSTDGRRIFFTVSDSVISGDGALYLREDGATTIQINASEKTIPDSPTAATFWAASADGSKAFFTTEEPLIDEDKDGKSLYRYDRDAPVGQRLSVLSVDHEPSDGLGEVRDVYGASDDGSYVYFSVSSQLVANEPPAPPGGTLLFVWHDGQVSYIGTINSSSNDDYANVPFSWNLSNQAARVTPDGRHALFLSSSPNQPTGDASGPCPGGQPCRRLYVYSAAADGGSGALACASCPPDGSPALSEANVIPRVGTAGAISDSHLNHPITDDGRLVFFSTSDRLVPEDINGRIDVYSYDTLAGQVRLISSGQANDDAYFLEATPDASDVFFTTREQLVGWDIDNLTDLYDARIGGGLPEPPPPPPSCQGDACQPAAASLNDPTPASSAFAGPGNPSGTPAGGRRCPKGKRPVRSKGRIRCIAKKRTSRNGNRANTDRRAIR